jgi:hypothetical protein
MNKQLNEQQIVQKWSPMIEQVTGLKDKSKLSWVSKYAHFHALNEVADGMGGVSTPYATLYNVPGIGNVQPASLAGTTGAQQTSGLTKGSGDKWPALLPMALQVAARTIGFDLVNVVPMPGPTGVISYLDYVYAGGKQPWGAPPANSPATANPRGPYSLAQDPTTGNSVSGHNPIYDKYDAPHAFKVQISSVTAAALVEGETVIFGAPTNTVETEYIGKSRIDGFGMFRRKEELVNGGFGAAGLNLSDVFTAIGILVNPASAADGTTLSFPSLISTLEDQVMGFVGAGPADEDQWSGNFVNGNTLYEPMERGVGEVEYPKALGLQVFTKFIAVGTFQVSVSVTLEQIQDLNKQWGIDVIAMVENAGINEISQAINKHILSRLFGLGWLNHNRAYAVEGINLNLDVTTTAGGTTPGYAYNEGGVVVTGVTMPMPGAYFPPALPAAFENQDTLIKRIMAVIVAAGNVVMQRGRRGPANFIVTNLKLATALQTNAQYVFSPITNTFTQSNGSLYPLGTIAGMTLYVDPNMTYADTRVLVGRKGATDEPGVIFAPYLMAESVKLITEGTAAPKVIIKSRYALVDAGFHPETQYVTLYIKTSTGAVI